LPFDEKIVWTSTGNYFFKYYYIDAKIYLGALESNIVPKTLLVLGGGY
jgi:hypothetical protein